MGTVSGQVGTYFRSFILISYKRMNISQAPKSAIQQSSQATRQALMRATVEVVRDRGIQGVTSREIARRASVNLASITYHFGSQQALVAHALFGELEQKLAAPLAALSTEDQPVNRLFAALVALLSEFDRSTVDVVTTLEALVAATRTGPLREAATSTLERVEQQLAEVIAALRTSGSVAAWVEPDAMAALLVATAYGVALQTCLRPEGPNQVAMASQLSMLLLSASLSEPNQRPTVGAAEEILSESLNLGLKKSVG